MVLLLLLLLFAGASQGDALKWQADISLNVEGAVPADRQGPALP